jgi:hypothetical protein
VALERVLDIRRACPGLSGFHRFVRFPLGYQDQPPTRVARSGVRATRPPLRVSHWCYTQFVPTTRPRHAVTETPPVKQALDELRAEMGSERVPLGELVILGARAKTAELRAQRGDNAQRKRRLADRIRSRERPPFDPGAADEAKRLWARY